jgi:hypothetical protein
MKAISQDLRERILDTVERRDGSLRQIAGRFLVSVSFITRLLQLHRSTGSLEPRPHGGGNPAVLGPEELEQLREFVRQQPDARLDELRSAPPCSLMTISRPSQTGAAAKEDPASPGARPPRRPRATAGILRSWPAGPATAGLVDESGANTAMTRTHGRAPVDSVSTPIPRPMGVDHNDLWDAVVRGHAAGLFWGHQHRHLSPCRRRWSPS